MSKSYEEVSVAFRIFRYIRAYTKDPRATLYRMPLIDLRTQNEAHLEPMVGYTLIVHPAVNGDLVETLGR